MMDNSKMVRLSLHVDETEMMEQWIVVYYLFVYAFIRLINYLLTHAGLYGKMFSQL